MTQVTTPQRTPRSLQARLLLAVLTLVLLAWASAAALTWHEAEDEVGDLLDAHLAQTAALLRLQPLDPLGEDPLSEAPQLDKHQTRVVFQLWREDQLLTRSKTAPDAPLTDRPKRGFDNSRVDGKTWRVFVAPGRESGTRMLVGERQSARQDIVMASVHQHDQAADLGAALAGAGHLVGGARLRVAAAPAGPRRGHTPAAVAGAVGGGTQHPV